MLTKDQRNYMVNEQRQTIRKVYIANKSTS